MERRKVLLGSGATLAALLAGCSETAEENGTDDGDDGGGSSGGDDGDGSDGGGDDIPGFDQDELSVDNPDVTIEHVEQSDDVVLVTVTTTLTDDDALDDEIEAMARELAGAVKDPQAFVAAIDAIEVTIYDEDERRLLSVYVDVEWLLAYLDGEVDTDEFVEEVLEEADGY